MHLRVSLSPPFVDCCAWATGNTRPTFRPSQLARVQTLAVLLPRAASATGRTRAAALLEQLRQRWLGHLPLARQRASRGCKIRCVGMTPACCVAPPQRPPLPTPLFTTVAAAAYRVSFVQVQQRWAASADDDAARAGEGVSGSESSGADDEDNVAEADGAVRWARVADCIHDVCGS